MFCNLNNDNLIYIYMFFDIKNKINLIKTCKYLKNLFYKIGYLKNINHSHDDDPCKFSINFMKHNRSLNSVYIYYLKNPQYWMPGSWPKKVIINSYITDKIDPIISNTEELKIVTKGILKINWKKFPKLKILYIDCDTINLDGIEYCEKLELVHLITNNIIPNNIGNLKNLKYLLTNNSVYNYTHFKSLKLHTCVANNNLEHSSIIFDTKENIYNNTSVIKKYYYCTELMYNSYYQEIEI